MTRRAATASIALLTSVLVAAGCATGTSLWEDNFRQAPFTTTEALPDGARVTMREAPWEGVGGALAELQREYEELGVPFREWPEDERRRFEERLLRALDVRGDLDAVSVLGRSVFRTTSSVDPIDGKLAEFAASVGADQVVWLRHHEGKTKAVVQQRTYDVARVPSFSGAGRPGSAGRMEAVPTMNYAPVVVEMDEFAWVAYYIRR